MAGTLTISTLSDGTNSTSSTNCIQGSAKAWVNFNGSTAAIRASYNVSSVTRNGTGDYTVNFTNAMSDANYGFSTQAGNGAATNWIAGGPYTSAPTSSAFRFYTGTTSVTSDLTYVSAAIFR